MAIFRRKKTDQPSKKMNPKAVLALANALEPVLKRWDNSKSEHVEETVYEAISALLEEGIIQINGEDLEMSAVLRQLLGSDSNLIEEAERFEQLINGYLGDIEWDDMEDAYYLLERIVSELK